MTQAIFRQNLCTNAPPSGVSMKGQWCILHGFSKLAAKEDLDLVLGNIIPLDVHQLVTNKLFPSGSFAVSLPDRYTMRSLMASSKERFGDKYSIESIDYHKLRKVSIFAKQYSITDRTVRCYRLSPNIGMEELLLHFEDYNIRRDNITRVPKLESPQFFIQFPSREDAVRAVAEKLRMASYGFKFKLFLYPY